MNDIWPRVCPASIFVLVAGANPLFPPLSPEQAEVEIEHLLHQSPRQHGIARTRWRLQDVGRALQWLHGRSDAGIYKVLKRLGFSRKKALRFIRSPDPNYRFKWQRILAAYQEAVARPGQVVLLFQDEFTYYRRAKLRKQYQRRGKRPRRHHHHPGANTKARVAAVMDAITGRVLYRQRSKIGRKELVAFYQQIRAAYPDAERIYLVEDNWPVHKHPDVLQAAKAENLSLLFLPTYASWLNPIEKLWRWLRQDILHNHNESKHFKQLRSQVEEWLEQFSNGSLYLLHYVGILAKEELDAIPVLIC